MRAALLAVLAGTAAAGAAVQKTAAGTPASAYRARRPHREGQIHIYIYIYI